MLGGEGREKGKRGVGEGRGPSRGGGWEVGGGR